MQQSAVLTTDNGFAALARVAGFYRIAADPQQLRHQLSLTGKPAHVEHLVRTGALVGLKTKHVPAPSAARLLRAPKPLIVTLKDASFAVLAGIDAAGSYRVVDPVGQAFPTLAHDALHAEWTGGAILTNASRLH